VSTRKTRMTTIVGGKATARSKFPTYLKQSLAATATELATDLSQRRMDEQIIPSIGAFQYLLLCAVAVLPPEQCYGAAIKSWCETQLKREINLGQIYGSLQRLEDRLLLTTKTAHVRAGPTAANRPVIVYTLTAPGEAAVTVARAFITQAGTPQPQSAGDQ
jgi:DNA-binding PadR family transcriptional regulator